MWDPLVYRKLLKLKSEKFTHILLRSSALYGNDIFSARGRAWGTAPPLVNLGPLRFGKLLELKS